MLVLLLPTHCVQYASLIQGRRFKAGRTSGHAGYFLHALSCVLCPAALKSSFLLPDLEDAIMQFDVELRQFGPNLQEVRWQLAVCTCQIAHALWAFRSKAEKLLQCTNASCTKTSCS